MKSHETVVIDRNKPICNVCIGQIKLKFREIFTLRKMTLNEFENFVETKGTTLEEIQKNSITQHEEERKKELEKNSVKCPNCDSINLQHLGNDRKGFSVGKALGGAVLTGGIGTLAGFAGKKGKIGRESCTARE